MANVRISELTTLSTVDDSTILPVVSSSVTKKITADTLKTYVNNTTSISTTALQVGFGPSGQLTDISKIVLAQSLIGS